MRRRRFITAVGGSVATVGIAGCSGGDSDTTTDPSTSTTTSDDSSPIKLGVVFAQSGPLASAARGGLNSAELIRQHINEDGGIGGRELEVYTRDSAGSVETAVSKARELVNEENIDILTGGIASNITLGMSEFSAAAQVPFVGTPTVASGLTGESCRETFFRIGGGNNSHQNAAAARATEQLTEGTKIAAVHPDFSLGRGAWESYKAEVDNLYDDYEVIETHFTGLSQSDYSNVITSLIDSDADIVHSSLYAGLLIAFIKQARQRNFFEAIEAFTTITNLVDVTSAFDAPPSWINTVYYYFDYADNAVSDRFVESYRNQFNTLPSTISSTVYTDLLGVKQAVENEGDSSTGAIINGLEGLEFEAPGGTFYVRPEDHQGIREAYVSGWTGPIDEVDFYGIPEVTPTPEADIALEPNCTF
jgi:branched-chain amino acid transport system substrate-binding protein